jgi:hypothetical protein
MARRIDIGAILNRPRLIRLITLAWILLLIVGSLHVDGLVEVVGFLQSARLIEVFGFLHSAGLPAAIGSLPAVPLSVAVGPLLPAGPGPVVDLHRAFHWLAFGGAAFLLLLLSRNRRQEIRSVSAICLLGLSLEYLQHIIYRIDIEWFDVRDDAFAALVALALFRLAGNLQGCFPGHGRRSGI